MYFTIQDVLENNAYPSLPTEGRHFVHLSLQCIATHYLIKELEDHGFLTKDALAIINEHDPDCQLVSLDPNKCVNSIIHAIEEFRKQSSGFCRPWKIFISGKLYKIIRELYDLPDNSDITLLGITSKVSVLPNELDFIAVNSPKDTWIPITKVITTGKLNA